MAARHGAAVRSCPRPSSVRWAGPRPLPAALRSTASGAYSFVQTPWGWASDSYSENSELEFQAAGMPLEVLKCPNGQCGVTTFYVLGTAHVSKQSCRDAQSLIRRLRPDVVFLELCRERERDCLEDAEQVITSRAVLPSTPAAAIVNIWHLAGECTAAAAIPTALLHFLISFIAHPLGWTTSISGPPSPIIAHAGGRAFLMEESQRGWGAVRNGSHHVVSLWHSGDTRCSRH